MPAETGQGRDTLPRYLVYWDTPGHPQGTVSPLPQSVTCAGKMKKNLKTSPESLIHTHDVQGLRAVWRLCLLNSAWLEAWLQLVRFSLKNFLISHGFQLLSPCLGLKELHVQCLGGCRPADTWSVVSFYHNYRTE